MDQSDSPDLSEPLLAGDGARPDPLVGGEEPACVLFLPDTPASDPHHFNFERITNALHSFVVSASAKDPFNICVSGGWGTGKTTLLRNLERSLSEEPAEDDVRNVTIWFEPWKLAGEEEVRNVLARRVLDVITEDAGFVEGARIDVAGRNILRVLSDRFLGVGIDDVSRAYRAEQATRDTFAEVEDLFRRIAEVYLTGKRRRRLIVFVDDLDRCRPERVVEVLEAVKLFFDLPGIVFVFALDREKAECAVMVRYDYSAHDARVYLEKIFQLKAPLPRKRSDDLVRYLDEELAKVGVAIDDERLAQAIVLRFGRNLRDLKLFINSFSFQRELIDDPALELSDEQLLKWLYLEATMPSSLSVGLAEGSLNLVLALELIAYGGFLHDPAQFNRYVAELRQSTVNYCALIVFAIVSANTDELASVQLTNDQQAIVEALTHDGALVPTLRVLREGGARLIDTDLRRIAFLVDNELQVEAPQPSAGSTEKEESGPLSLEAGSPVTARDWDLLGDRLRMGGDSVHAYLCYLIAVLMNPRSVVYIGDLGRAMRLNGKVDASKALVSSAYRLDPPGHYIHTETAYLYDIQLQRRELGSLLYRKARLVGASVGSVPYNLSWNLASEGRFREAYLACLDACMLDRDDTKKRRRLYDYARKAGVPVAAGTTDEQLERELAQAVNRGEYPLPLSDDEERQIAELFEGHPRMEDVADELSRPPL